MEGGNELRKSHDLSEEVEKTEKMTTSSKARNEVKRSKGREQIQSSNKFMAQSNY